MNHHLVGPEITSFPQNPFGTVEGAENVRFECVVQSNPMATVRWFINNEFYNGSFPDLYDISNTTDVNPQSENVVIRSFFRIKKVRKDDLAKYTCQATNNVIDQGEKTTNQSATLIISRELGKSLFFLCVSICASIRTGNLFLRKIGFCFWNLILKVYAT